MSFLLEHKRENLTRLLGRMKPAGRGQIGRELVEYPPLLQLEITSRCNLRCLKCGHGNDPPGTARIRPRDLAPSVIEALADVYRSAIRVHTFGFGEMFLYPRLRELIETLKRFECAVDGITNGVLIGSREIDWLVASGLDELTFSIDGFEEETMRRLRGVSVEGLWRTLELLDRKKKELSSPLPRVIVNFVAERSNLHELPALIRRVSELGAVFVGVNTLHHQKWIEGTTEPYRRYYHENSLSHVPRPELEALLLEARQLGEARSVGVGIFINFDEIYPPAGHQGEDAPPTVPASAPDQEPRLEPFYCTYPWISLYLRADAGTNVCCTMADTFPAIRTMEELNEVWNGPPLRALRAAIAAGEVHPSCAVCVQKGYYRTSTAALRELEATVGLQARP
jgi:MoaA/NifB/PqqE/SkfB family radical SAM enzyme